MLSALLLLSLAAVPQSTPTPAWPGVWVEEHPAAGRSADCLLFEPTRCGWLRDGRADFYRAQYLPGSVRLERWGRLTELSLEVVEQGLRVSGPHGEQLFARAQDVPAALRVDPYVLPADVDVDADTRAMLTRDLLERRVLDQGVRTEGADPAQMSRVDADNTEFLRAVIEELGWIDAERFGAAAADAAFLLVQHSPDLRLMRTALPRIEADVRAERLDGQAFALLHDRLMLNLGFLQRYGSQIGTLADGTSVLMPCEAPGQVDARRRELGMRPLAEYLAYFADEDGMPPRPLEHVLASQPAPERSDSSSSQRP